MKTNKFFILLGISICFLFYNCSKNSPTEPAVKEDINDLMVFASGYTNSTTTPMGNHYEGLHITTAADRAWLKDPNNQPPVPQGLSSLHIETFTVFLYPYGDPMPADVNQHAIGNCGGLAALASMSYLNDSFVKSIITDNKNGTFSVFMFDPQGQRDTVVVDSKFLADSNGNIAAVSGKHNLATWATVLEKAIMKYNVIYHANDDIGGIGSEHTTPLFTGKGFSFAFDRGVLTPDQLARAVRVSLAQGKFVIGGFGEAMTVGNLKTVTAHAYTFTISSDASALFAVRNPWGANPTANGGLDGNNDGILNIPLPEGEIDYSQSETVYETIDLRIIDPGLAGTDGVTEAYVPPTITGEAVRLSKELLERYHIDLK